jgi:hypothetical protein
MLNSGDVIELANIQEQLKCLDILNDILRKFKKFDCEIC